MLQNSQLAGNLLWNGAIDLSVVYSGKAIARMQAISGRLLGGLIFHCKFHSGSPH